MLKKLRSNRKPTNNFGTSFSQQPKHLISPQKNGSKGGIGREWMDKNSKFRDSVSRTRIVGRMECIKREKKLEQLYKRESTEGNAVYSV